jgi:hypothetical protein
MYLLGKDRDKHNIEFTFADFFPMEELSLEHSGLDIISMQEFLQQTAMQGQLRNKKTGQVEFPPENRTNWDGQDFKVLKEWLRAVSMTPRWKPSSCLAVIPAQGGAADVQHLLDIQQQIKADGKVFAKFVDDPVPVDASPKERMRENLAGRSELCVYDQEMQQEPVLHFMCSHKERVRMLGKSNKYFFACTWMCLYCKY